MHDAAPQLEAIGKELDANQYLGARGRHDTMGADQPSLYRADPHSFHHRQGTVLLENGPGIACVLIALVMPTLSPTPLVLDHVLSDRLGRRVWLKGELLQRTGSFKSRGALNWLHKASTEVLAGGLGAVSAGNHALGLAWAAQAAGVACLLEDAVALPPSGDIVVVITGGNLGREELEGFL